MPAITVKALKTIQSFLGSLRSVLSRRITKQTEIEEAINKIQPTPGFQDKSTTTWVSRTDSDNIDIPPTKSFKANNHYRLIV